MSALPPRLQLALRVWRGRLMEADDFRWLGRLGDPRRSAVDIGANVGVYSVFLRRYARKVHAIEPHPSLAALLRRSLPSDVEVIDCALSDRSGTAHLRVPLIGGRPQAALASIDPSNRVAAGDESQSVPVPTRRLDDLDLGPVGLMKIDVEGHEGAVLRGAHRTIEEDRPAILVEVEDRHRPGAVAQVRAFLQERGYSGFFRQDGRFQPLERFDLRLHQNPDCIAADGRRRGGLYINNFLYLADPMQIGRVIP